MKVAVIGCGPAGLAAAHAAVGLGAAVTVIAPKQQTPQRGPLLIQRPIPGINTSHPDATIYQCVVGGSILDYRYKLYGDINIGINGNILQPHYHAWDHFRTYDRLWELYQDLVQDRTVSSIELMDMQDEYDLVVSTASAQKLCHRNQVLEARHSTSDMHTFQFAPVRITPYCEYPEQPDNTIVFNADPNVQWVRSSRVFGNEVTEWPANGMLLDASGKIREDSRLILKPIWTNCNCYPRVLRTGRFGKWKNETWVDTAYWDTYEAIDGHRRAPEIARIV